MRPAQGAISSLHRESYFSDQPAVDIAEQGGPGSGCPQAQDNSHTAGSSLEAGVPPHSSVPQGAFSGMASLCICPRRTDVVTWLGYLPACTRLELDSCWEGLTFPKPKCFPKIHYPPLQTNSSDLAIPTGSKTESVCDAGE